MKLLCGHLGLDLKSVLGLPTAPRVVSRSALIREARQKQGLTEGQLADAIGYEAVVVHKMETDDAFLESYPVGFAFELASALQLPPRALLDFP